MGQALKFCTTCENKRGCDQCADLHEWIMDHLDAEKVVRCRDCKFGVTPYGDEHDGWIECSNIHSRPLFGCNGFCSYGERKDGDGNG